MSARSPYKRRTPARRTGVAFPTLCAAVGLPRPVPEHRFHATRKWRFDWAFIDQKVAVEQEGAVWTRGRHTRGSGYIKDMEKYNAAAALGWRIVRGTPQQLASGAILESVQQAIGASK